MNKKINIIIILFFCLFSQLFAQITVSGRIIDEKGETFSGISIVLSSLPDSTFISYAFSDANGNYTLTYDGPNENLLLSIKAMTIVPQNKIITKKTQKVNFVVKEFTFLLDEVTVRANKIWGQNDTLNYLVSSFSSKNDVVIGDVLKKMPGISVEESGAIYYQGKPINKFYVENLDLLGGRYGIATNNISSKVVTTVQVYENHQPIKALDGIKISSDAAINIKLKEEAKGTLGIMALLGVGAPPFQWENELTSTYFERKRQNISTFKSINSGTDLSNELQSFTDRNNEDYNDVLGIIVPSPPSIKQNRYLFNNSNAVTINNLFKTDEEGQVNLNIFYLNDYENRDSHARSSYFMGNDSVLVIDEEMHYAGNTDRIEGELKYNRNTNTNYLNNKIYLQGLWTNKLGLVTVVKDIEQRIKSPTFSISNSFHWIKKQGNENGLELKSSIGFSSNPQTLSVYPGLYEDIFNEGEPFEKLKQKARSQHFFSNNTINLLSPWVVNKLIFSTNMDLDFANKTLSSDIYKESADKETLFAADSLRNNLNKMNLVVNPSLNIKYNLEKLKLSANFPLGYHFIQLDNRITGDMEKTHKLLFQPSFYMYYYLSNDVNIDGNFAIFNQLGDIGTLYTGYILENYRVLNHYDNRLLERHGNSANIKISYKDILKVLFVRMGVNYNYSKQNILYAQYFQDILSMTSSIPMDNSTKGISANMKISKGFDFLNTLLNIEGRYGVTNAERLRQEQLIKYKNEGYNIKGTLNTQLFSWMKLEYEGIWNEGRSKILGEQSFIPIRTLRNIASGDFFLPSGINLRLAYEHYYNSTALDNRHLSFADLSLNYTWKRVNFSVDWNNIFNKNSYVSAYYSDINAFQHIYMIRKSNIMLKMRMKLK